MARVIAARHLLAAGVTGAVIAATGEETEAETGAEMEAQTGAVMAARKRVDRKVAGRRSHRRVIRAGQRQRPHRRRSSRAGPRRMSADRSGVSSRRNNPSMTTNAYVPSVLHAEPPELSSDSGRFLL